MLTDAMIGNFEALASRDRFAAQAVAQQVIDELRRERKERREEIAAIRDALGGLLPDEDVLDGAKRVARRAGATARAFNAMQSEISALETAIEDAATVARMHLMQIVKDQSADVEEK